ncbi:MAG TPA: hypothetical protein VMK65_11030, partial [Longimicrobiales bacterium]|nr:hypothetical protein [Longimicrobiales bacterium]
EKLHEELIAEDEDSRPTEMEKIRIVAHRNGRIPDLLSRALQWECCDDGEELTAELRALFPTLAPAQPTRDRQVAEVSAAS